jgi:hypothetical protein
MEEYEILEMPAPPPKPGEDTSTGYDWVPQEDHVDLLLFQVADSDARLAHWLEWEIPWSEALLYIARKKATLWRPHKSD